MILHEASGKKVWLVVYSHKHGVDHAVAKTEASAWRVAASWAYEEVVCNDRHEGDHPHLKELATTQPEDGTDEDCMKADQRFVEAYNEVERDMSYGECLEVEELDLIG